MTDKAYKDLTGQCERCGTLYAGDICVFIKATAEYVCPACLNKPTVELPWSINSEGYITGGPNGVIICRCDAMSPDGPDAEVFGSQMRQINPEGL